MYSSVSVLRLSVSSGSSRQSITAIWCSVAYCALILTIRPSASIPMYLRLCPDERKKRAVIIAQLSSSRAFGTILVMVRTYTQVDPGHVRWLTSGRCVRC